MNALAQKQAVLQALGNAGMGVSPQQLSPSVLRRDSTRLGTQGLIQFGFQKNGSSGVSSTSILLENNDSFIVTDIALLIKKCGDSSDLHAASISYNHYSSLVFTGANDGNLQAIYNGALSVTIDKTQYLPSLATSVFERIPDTQQGTTTTAFVNAAGANATTIIARDAKNHALYGFFPVSPFILKGNNETQSIQVNLPDSVNMTSGTQADNFATLVFNGYLVSNKN
jgi:hypothetical protein